MAEREKVLLVEVQTSMFATGIDALLNASEAWKEFPRETLVNPDAKYSSIQWGTSRLAFLNDPAFLPRLISDKCTVVVLDSSDEKQIQLGLDALMAHEYHIDPACHPDNWRKLTKAEIVLTPRQREILQMYADGMQTDGIAYELGLSTETIRTHTKRILAKMNVHTRNHAIAIGIREGMIH